MTDLGDKTVFFLDHCSCMRESSGLPLEIDTGNRSRPSNLGYLQFIPPVTKTLWTHVVENTLEYARILWDIYPERLIRIVVNNPDEGKPVNSWRSTHQTINNLCEAFAEVGPASKQTGKIANGFKAALEALQEPTVAQIQMMGSSSSMKVTNRGRIICVTSCTSDLDLEDLFLTKLTACNKDAVASNTLLPIHECEFVLISLHPMGKENKARVLSRPLHQLSGILRSQIYVVTPDRIYDRLTELCVSHHNLVTSTVTGIPMKEEQNSTASANYDVHLFHPQMSLTYTESLVLRWAAPTAPKVGTNSLQHCNGASRITPVDVTSRPSICLSNFVVNGRSVSLETPKKGKSTTHLLTSYGGEMWIHILETARNVLEDPPSISEGIGGRVTDYRIPDFVEFMKLNLLAPYPVLTSKEITRRLSTEGASKIKLPLNPIDMAKVRLQRKTVYWPLTISGSLLFPMAVHLETFLRLVPHDSLTEMEKVECEKTIWQLMTIEARGEPPPIPSPYHKKGHKRDEEWRQVYTEMENFLRANLHSDMHKCVLDCFMESRRKDDSRSGKDKKRKESEVEKTVNESDKKALATDSPMSPMEMDTSEQEPPVKSKRLDFYSLWTQKTEKKDLRAIALGAKLYPHLENAEAKGPKSVIPQ